MAKRMVTLEELKQGIDLATGETHVLTLRFEQQLNLLVEGAVFAFESAFPAAGASLYLEQAQREFERLSDERIVVFGHADVKGDNAYNKTLSDRRAKAALAMITRDVKLLDAVAECESWGVEQYQAMLRALGCNPGTIDGAEGEMTHAALRGFQREYNQGVYHDHEGSPPRAHKDLVVDGALGPQTEAALRDAYVARSPCRVEASRLNAPSFAGCGELNPISDEDDENRRVMIALVGATGPKAGDFPCREGNARACPTDGKQKMRCKFYRGHFRELRRLEVVPFFDFKWLQEKAGAVHLSALTPLPDGPARFTIYRCELPITDPMPNSRDNVERPSSVGLELGTLAGEIRGGVAFARWSPPEDFDPFDYQSWLVDHDFDLGLFGGEEPNGGSVSGENLLAATSAHPPVFLVEAGEHWGFSLPPTQDLDDVRITQESNGSGVAIGYDFGLVPWAATEGRTAPANALPPDVGVLALIMAGRELTVEDDANEEEGAES